MKLISTIAYDIYLETNKHDYVTEEPLDLKRLVIAFSEFCSSNKSNNIYSGNENIPFRERHPIYKTIFNKKFNKNKRDIP